MKTRKKYAHFLLLELGHTYTASIDMYAHEGELELCPPVLCHPPPFDLYMCNRKLFNGCIDLVLSGEASGSDNGGDGEKVVVCGS